MCDNSIIKDSEYESKNIGGLYLGDTSYADKNNRYSDYNYYRKLYRK